MILREATLAEARERDGATYREWGGRLTPEQYLMREGRLRESAFAQKSLTTWLLVDNGAILASCETYAGPSRIAPPAGGSAAEKPAVLPPVPPAAVPGTSYAVASLFVEPGLRRRGLGSELVRRLLETLRGRGAQSVVLFSDIGDRFYSRLGFHPVPARSRVWRPQDPSVDGGTVDLDLTPPPAAATPFGLQELGAALEHIQADPAANRGGVRLLATADRLVWHVERARFYARALGRRFPVVVGARQGRAAIVFAPDYKKDRLMVLAVRPGQELETVSVIEAARLEALRMGVQHLEAWEPECLTGRLPGGELVVRRDELPMIAVLVPGVPASGWIDATRALWV